MLEEAHPLAVRLSFSISLGLLPVTLSLKTANCGIKNSGLPEEEAGDLESSSKESNPPTLMGHLLTVLFFTMMLSLVCLFL